MAEPGFPAPLSGGHVRDVHDTTTSGERNKSRSRLQCLESFHSLSFPAEQKKVWLIASTVISLWLARSYHLHTITPYVRWSAPKHPFLIQIQIILCPLGTIWPKCLPFFCRLCRQCCCCQRAQQSLSLVASRSSRGALREGVGHLAVRNKHATTALATLRPVDA